MLLCWPIFSAVIKQTDSKDYGRTSYIFTTVATPINYMSHHCCCPPVGHRCYSQMLVTQNMEWQVIFPATTPLWLRKDMLHFCSCYLNPQPDYGKTGYISPPATIPPHYIRTLPLLLPHPYPLITEGQVTFPLLLPPLITEGQVSFPLLLIMERQFTVKP